MKIKSLILGSVAAAGLSTGAYAADLNVLTSLDVCDALGISGLTISSDTNCLQITGGVEYSFKWGDFKGNGLPGIAGQTFNFQPADNYTVDANDGVDPNTQDWENDLTAWVKFAATADSDFGPAMAVIKLKDRKQSRWHNETQTRTSDFGNTTGDNTGGVIVDEAYVSIGAEPIAIFAGKKGTIMNTGDDEPFNFLGLYNSEEIDAGVSWSDNGNVDDGGNVIQVVGSLGNGLTAKGGLEDLGGEGTLVGVLEYAGDSVSAHGTFVANNILTGEVANWATHLGATVSMDQFKVRGAFAYNSDDTTTAGDQEYWSALASAQGTFDMFTLAASVEAARGNELGAGVSGGANVADGVAINAGFRWFDFDTTTANTETWQAALQLVADLTETMTVTGELGLYGETATDQTVTYGSAQLAWNPGGGFKSSIGGEVNSAGAYKVTYKASKSFQ